MVEKELLRERGVIIAWSRAQQPQVHDPFSNSIA